MWKTSENTVENVQKNLFFDAKNKQNHQNAVEFLKKMQKNITIVYV